MPSIILLLKGPPPLPPPVLHGIETRYPGKLEEFRADASPLARTDDEERLSKLLAAESGQVQVLLYGFAADEPVPERLLWILASQPVHSIERIDVTGGFVSFHPHRPWHERRARVLIVFPGSIVPLTMGSHRRAFQLAANLAARGCPADLLISGPSKSAIAGAKPLLHQIAARVHHYANNRPPLPVILRWRRWLERAFRAVCFDTSVPPALFEERLATAAPLVGSKNLRRLVETGGYENILISYAWLANIRRALVPRELKSVRWICDTHDVQYVRNATENHSERRFLVSEEREKKAELGVLASFDKVLAISKADAEALAAELGGEKVISTPPGFDYALDEPRLPDLEAPVFGFIGRKMLANEKALAEILTEWWPAIHARWPRAVLRLAGGIGDSKRLEAHATAIQNDGKVADLAAWYRSIDVMLNPVMVRGGLNFKSVETLMAGRLLLTNGMGAVCLGNPAFSKVAESGEEAVAVLAEAFCPPGGYLEERLAVREEARRVFGDEASSRELLRYLAEMSGDVRRKAPVKTAQRILIQCGDHLENRHRVSALAVAIRKRGHHPVVLVYSPQFVAPFLARGIDAVALKSFNEIPSERAARIARMRRVKNLSRPYRGFDLDDLTEIARTKAPEEFTPEGLPRTIRGLATAIDRILRMLDHVAPDQLVIWNGYTGNPANILRQYARMKDLPAAFMERSVFPDGVFVDPGGSNGSSELSKLDINELRALGSTSANRPSSTLTPSIPREEIRQLRKSGPWREARKLIFVPLQVQADTNILLYSPDCRTMADLVSLVHHTYHGPGVAIIVRPHPEEIPRDLSLPELTDTYVDAAGTLDAWLEAADLVVTINSTVGLHALVKGTPVRSLGNAIYTGKGLTAEIPPDRPEFERFWNILLDRYTSTPDSPFPQCLEDRLPSVEPSKVPAKNLLGVDPESALLYARIAARGIIRDARASGVLGVSADLAPDDLLALDYRRTAVPFHQDWLAARLREELGLSPEIEIRFSEENPLIRVRREPSPDDSEPTFDRYGWMISGGSGPA